MSRRLAGAFVVIVLAGPARAEPGASTRTGGAENVDAGPEALIARGTRAYAHRDWNEAARDFRAALERTPDDARLRAKLRRALERRAEAREALAAHAPPPPPPSMSDGTREPPDVSVLKDVRRQVQLRRAALEARIDAESARPRPDEKRLAKLRADAATIKAEEDRLTIKIHAALDDADAFRAAEEQRTFPGVTKTRGIGRFPDAGAP
jgi:hypothetical protein